MIGYEKHKFLLPGGDNLYMKPFKLFTSVFLLLCAFQQAGAADSPHEQIQVLVDQNHLQEALKLADETLARDESDIRMQFLKGLILTKLNDLENAQKVFEKLTTEHPELPEPFNNLAVIYAFKGEYDKAELALLTAINTHPTYATAHENLGDIYAKMATQAYNQALALDQENPYVKEKLLLVNELFSVPEAAPVALVQQEAEEIKKAAEPIPQAVEAAGDRTQQIPESEPKKEAEATKPPVKTASVEKQEDDAIKTEVIMAMKAWANAWSSKDVNVYLGSYAAEFVPPNKLSRKKWDAQRKERLEAPKFIKVELSAINIVFDDRKRARVRFLQQYESDTYSDRVKKEIVMEKNDGKWLITSERAR